MSSEWFLNHRWRSLWSGTHPLGLDINSLTTSDTHLFRPSIFVKVSLGQYLFKSMKTLKIEGPELVQEYHS